MSRDADASGEASCKASVLQLVLQQAHMHGIIIVHRAAAKLTVGSPCQGRFILMRQAGAKFSWMMNNRSGTFLLSLVEFSYGCRLWHFRSCCSRDSLTL